jgi:hypothetical protein
LNAPNASRKIFSAALISCSQLRHRAGSLPH